MTRWLSLTQVWVNLSLTKILEDLLEVFQSPAPEKGITLQSYLLGEIIVKGDVIEFNRLYRNLLENALYYTPSGGKVAVTMKRVRNNDQ